MVENVQSLQNKLADMRRKLAHVPALNQTIDRLQGEDRELRRQLEEAQKTIVQLQHDLRQQTIAQGVPNPIPEPLSHTPLYQGNYDALFNCPKDQPIISRKAIAWLLKDYGQSRHGETPADTVYQRISRCSL